MRELNLVIEILINLKNAMGDGETDPYLLSPDAYEDVNANTFQRVLEMMIEEDLINGVALVSYGIDKVMAGKNQAKITLRGLEYLEQHYAMGWK